MSADLSSSQQTNSSQPTVETCLEASSWRHLQIVARKHNLPCSNRIRKVDFIHSLHQTLTNAQITPLIISQLEPTAQEALSALLAAKGVLPLHRFQERFGPIRQYRPKQETDSSKPWLTPTPTEQLLYLGLIYRYPAKATTGQQPQIVIPSELLGLLSKHFQATESSLGVRPLARPGYPPEFVVHLGLWLATVAQSPIRLQHQRWLPPRILGQLVQRMSIPASLPCRSERRAPYLSFLHQMATVAGFIEHGPYLQLTPEAWSWMAKPFHQKLQVLWQVYMPAPVQGAAGQSNDPSLSDGFGWEILTTNARGLIWQALSTLPSHEYTSLNKWVEQLRLKDQWGVSPGLRFSDWSDPNGVEIDPVAELCRGPLFWLGILNIALPDNKAISKNNNEAPSIQLSPTGAWLLNLPSGTEPTKPAPQALTISKQGQNLLVATAQTPANAIAWVAPYCIWEEAPEPKTGEQHLRLSAEQIAQATAHQIPANKIMQDIGYALTLSPSQPALSRRLRQRIRAWIKEGQRLRIHTQTIVETESAELMAELRRKKLIRRRLGLPISPNRAIISPEQVPGLITTLAALGIHAVDPFERSSVVGYQYSVGQSTDTPNTDTPNTDLPTTDLPKQTQWMLIQLYRSLGQHVNLSTKIPWEIEKALEAQLSPKERMSAAESARVVAEQIESSLAGYLRIPSWKMPILMEDEDEGQGEVEAETESKPEESGNSRRQSKTAIKRTLQEAIATSQPVRIYYWSANHDHPLQRTITPYYTEKRHHIEYLIGYCHLREEERVFRLDRIGEVGRLSTHH